MLTILWCRYCNCHSIPEGNEANQIKLAWIRLCNLFTWAVIVSILIGFQNTWYSRFRISSWEERIEIGENYLWNFFTFLMSLHNFALGCILEFCIGVGVEKYTFKKPLPRQYLLVFHSFWKPSWSFTCWF
jgi:hypothetical protein